MTEVMRKELNEIELKDCLRIISDPTQRFTHDQKGVAWDQMVASHRALAARAQAVENLRADLQSMTEARNSARADSNGYHAERELLKRRLAAMTAERDEALLREKSWAEDHAIAVAKYQEQLAASQARVRELEGEILKHRPKSECYDRVCQSLGISHDILGHVATLQTTLAERVAEVGELNVQLRDARQDAARLRMLIFRLLNDLPTKRDWLDPDLEKALKGA